MISQRNALCDAKIACPAQNLINRLVNTATDVSRTFNRGRLNFRGITGLIGFATRNTHVTAFGNPLLDTTIYLHDQSLLAKHNLKDDSATQVDANEMQSLIDDIENSEKFETTGGCAQNSLRVLQWLLRKQCTAYIFGSVGDDRAAEILKRLMEYDGVQTRYLTQQGEKTGHTIALVHGANRSLVAHLGAAEKLPLSDLLHLKAFEELTKSSDYVYMEGFFLTNRQETAKYVVDFCNEHKIKLLFNLSNEYMCEGYPDIVKYCVEKADVVFGNRIEFNALCTVFGRSDIDSTLRHLTDNFDGRKIMVITDGAQSITMRSNLDQEIIKVPLFEGAIVDTTGAGDAFVAGFIAGLLLKKSLPQCAKLGCYAAGSIIQETGCSIPKYSPVIPY